MAIAHCIHKQNFLFHRVKRLGTNSAIERMPSNIQILSVSILLRGEGGEAKKLRKASRHLFPRRRFPWVEGKQSFLFLANAVWKSKQRDARY